MVPWCGVQERTLPGWMSSISRIPPVIPKLNRRRALFVLTKIDEILVWEQHKETERDTRFVELGRYLCEVRSGQYWRGGGLKRLHQVLRRGVPGARRAAFYLA